jgi:hypothetical protein
VRPNKTMKGTVQGRVVESVRTRQHAMESPPKFVYKFDMTTKYALPTQARVTQPKTVVLSKNEGDYSRLSDLPERWTREILSMEEWDVITDILKLGEGVKLRTNDFQTYLDSDNMALFFREQRSEK